MMLAPMVKILILELWICVTLSCHGFIWGRELLDGGAPKVVSLVLGSDFGIVKWEPLHQWLWKYIYSLLCVNGS